ncbi:hypothetical protein ACFOUP_09325 [Belliella kenyensis]|uniref:Lipoprotein n=1 Tax=Belliella kenyensis TaxID=1472724 RepID=A0ABV8EJV7_9BACT|nr:hypothetical protein [Belliella kenyensis]MCH7403191.1 hypothetical protein [Belliella kenyensis]MDN3604802.1 hypothetical protein [Belliella kenyensis]
MYSKYRCIIGGLFIMVMFSCSGKLEVEGINLEDWKNDRYGCNGLRIQQLDQFQKIKNSFLGANNQSLIKTFGRPDRVILVDKSQSFFYYFFEPSSSKECPAYEGEETQPLKVMFRLNAINKVSEVTISRLEP